MKVGRRLAIKVLNAAKFVLSFETSSQTAAVTEPIDRAMLSALSEVVNQSGKAFEAYDHTKALELTETFFWNFTDDYLELVKERAYGQATTPEAQASAVFALRISLHTLLRLLAPFIPFATEEAWSWWQQGSVHLSNWPKSSELTDYSSGSDPKLMESASEALMGIRKSKSDQQLSMKAEIESIRIASANAAGLSSIADDLRSVGKIEKLEIISGETTEVQQVVFRP
jgi:valyl-tRNA synthetase